MQRWLAKWIRQKKEMAIWGCAWAWNWVLSNCTVGLFAGFNLVIGEVKHHLYVKRQTRICTTWSSFPLTCRLRFIISTHNLVVSRNFLSIRIVLSFFYQPVFYFEKCLTWIWRLPFAVYGKRKVSIKRFSRKLGHNLCPKTVPSATSK